MQENNDYLLMDKNPAKKNNNRITSGINTGPCPQSGCHRRPKQGTHDSPGNARVYVAHHYVAHHQRSPWVLYVRL